MNQELVKQLLLKDLHLELLLKDKKKLEKLKKENPNSSNIELLHKLLQNFSNKYSIPNLNMDNNNNPNDLPLNP